MTLTNQSEADEKAAEEYAVSIGLDPILATAATRKSKQIYLAGIKRERERMRLSTNRTLTKIRRLDAVITRFDKEFADDSDSTNNYHTNGYYTPKPSVKACDKYDAWKIDLENSYHELTAIIERLTKGEV